MPAILLDGLLDEDTSEELSHRLSDRGHNVERVVDIPDLGDGADDADVLEYAEQHDRVIVTHDEGFFERCDEGVGPTRLLWIIDQQGLKPYQKVAMIENVLNVLDDIDDLHDEPPAIPVSRAFL